MMKQGLIAGAFVAVGPLALAIQTAGATDLTGSDSVVKIICSLPGGGEATATGFVWPETGKVVTALHAVAGCVHVSAWSEVKGFYDDMDRILRVDLDSDLALIQMADGLGLPPVRFDQRPPDMQASFFAWGYPLVAQEMIELRIEFGVGRKAGVTTLGAAFASKELDQLFRDQDYPNRDTQILRVNTTIQPGHSGAPIFDDQGNVVAIADGGLLGGWRGINWSIPAYVYLPGLLDSEDVPPETASHFTELYSNLAEPARDERVAFGPSGASPSLDEDSQADELKLVRELSLRDLGEMLRASEIADGYALYEQLVFYLDDPDDVDRITYNIYEDNLSGATIGVPSDLELVWDDDLQAVVAINARQTVYYAAAVGNADSFDQAVKTRLDAFADRVTEGVEWKQEGIEIAQDEIDEAHETANFLAVQDGYDPSIAADVQLSLGLYVSGPIYLGVAVSMADTGEDAAKQDPIDYLKVALGAWYLTDFAAN